MGLFKSAVKKVAVAAVVVVGKRIANKVVGRVLARISRTGSVPVQKK